MNKTEAAVLKVERSTNPRVSTVERFVTALGGKLRVVAEIEGLAYELTFADKVSPPDNVKDTPPLSQSRPAWRIRARNDRHLEQAFLDQGFIAIGGETQETDFGHFLAIADRDERLAAIKAANPDRSRNAIGIFDGYGQSFAAHMQIGDTVAMPLTPRSRNEVRQVAIGEILGDYVYDPEVAAPSLRHRRAVTWLSTCVDRAEIDEDLRLAINAPGTLFRFGATDAAERLRSAAQLAG